MPTPILLTRPEPGEDKEAFIARVTAAVEEALQKHSAATPEDQPK